jgi:CRISPR-associated endonuclease/helicase Cas3
VVSCPPPIPPTPASLWAKISRNSDSQITGWHSLIDHSADVAAVVEALLAQPTLNRRLARTAGLTALDEIACARLAGLAFLHDIGKANRGFRARVDPRAPAVGHIDQLRWLFRGSNAEDLGDRLVDELRLQSIIDWFMPDSEICDAVFAHHGRPWKDKPSRAYWRVIDGSDPIAELAPMRASLERWFAPAFTAAVALPDRSEFDHAFAGLLMLADWLGSDTQFFPFANGADPDRMPTSRGAAAAALRAVGLAVEDRRQGVRVRQPDFATLFAVPAPRPIQQHATTPLADCVVLEAETGSGKTEAALWRFVHLFTQGAVDGLYFALPTRVAATQMFGRIKTLRDALFPIEDRPAVVLAVPGQVGVDDARGHSLPEFGFEWDDVPTDRQRSQRWAAEHPKRFLAAQIAVGTIDQVLLASIATRHAHLRGTALLRHLLVVDEVHASDRFMEALLANLLKGHLQAGGHVLLLSATLGAGAQARLLNTRLRDLTTAEALAYPAYGWAEAGEARVLPIAPPQEGKAVRITTEPWLDAPERIAIMARAAADAGAKVLVIRNTVGAAIATVQAIEAMGGATALFRVGEVTTLHHGRFSASDRLLLDAEVEKVLGKNSPRSAQIVVGTQTLEASLDLDADLLITDLCPMDVLLQRIGRLHRHAGRERPTGFEAPHVAVLTPAVRDLLEILRGKAGRHGFGRVYPDARIIEATWRLIEIWPVWELPAMNRLLVERATHPQALEKIEAELRAHDPAWPVVLDDAYGAALGQCRTAEFALLDRAAPFSQFQLPENEAWAPRLGAKDRLVRFDEVIGPFGQSIGELRVRHYLAQSVGLDENPVVVEHSAARLVFTFGSETLAYDRFGLRRFSLPAQAEINI